MLSDHSVVQKAMEEYSTRSIMRELDSIMPIELTQLGITHYTVKWVKGNMLVDFTKEQIDKIKKYKPNWNGEIVMRFI